MFEELKKLLVDEMQISEELIVPDAKLMADLGFNSLELADLVVLCEEKFDIEFDEDRAKTLLTVGEVADYLEELAG